MKIAYLGAGTWGFSLAALLAEKGYHVTSWDVNPELIQHLQETQEHPRFPGYPSKSRIKFTLDLEKALKNADLVIESVTSAGFRPVMEQLKGKIPNCPLVITSKGIEQGTGLILSDVVIEILGEEIRNRVASISGPSYASEVVRGLPTSVVGASYDQKTSEMVCKTFTTNTFRVYPNSDVRGVAYGGALKNVVAIACGVADGLQLGYSARAALMTRGLHEIQKLAVAQGCKKETLFGLSGMGDLCVTCSSMTSRNFQFGYLLTQGRSSKEAKEEVGMVVEGAYTAVSALELSKKTNIPMPITEAVHKIIYEGLKPKLAVRELMQREIKEEHL